MFKVVYSLKFSFKTIVLCALLTLLVCTLSCAFALESDVFSVQNGGVAYAGEISDAIYTLYCNEDGTIHKDSTVGEDVTATVNSAGFSYVSGGGYWLMDNFSFTTTAATGVEFVKPTSGSVTLKVKGTNSISVNKESAAFLIGLQFRSNATITDDGEDGADSLNISVVGRATSSSFGINDVTYELTISGSVSITASSATATSDSGGIMSNYLNITDTASVVATAVDGVAASIGLKVIVSVTVNGSATVVSNSGGTLDNEALKNGLSYGIGSSTCQIIEIAGNANVTVNAAGNNKTKNSVGLYSKYVRIRNTANVRASAGAYTNAEDALSCGVLCDYTGGGLTITGGKMYAKGESAAIKSTVADASIEVSDGYIALGSVTVDGALALAQVDGDSIKVEGNIAKQASIFKCVATVKIGSEETEYLETWADAVAAANGATVSATNIAVVTLLDDITTTLTTSVSKPWSLIGGTFTLKTITPDVCLLEMSNGASLEVLSGTYLSDGGSSVISNTSNGALSIVDGNFSATDTYVINNSSMGTISISGGEIYTAKTGADSSEPVAVYSMGNVSFTGGAVGNETNTTYNGFDVVDANFTMLSGASIYSEKTAITFDADSAKIAEDGYEGAASIQGGTISAGTTAIKMPYGGALTLSGSPSISTRNTDSYGDISIKKWVATNATTGTIDGSGYTGNEVSIYLEMKSDEGASGFEIGDVVVSNSTNLNKYSIKNTGMVLRAETPNLLLAPVVVSVGLDSDGDEVADAVKNYATFESAWNSVVDDYADNDSEHQIYVTLYQDVTAVAQDSDSDGKIDKSVFGTGNGFSYTNDIRVPQNKYIVLDLNGNKLDKSLVGKATKPYMMCNTILVVGNLTLCDTSKNQNGEITGSVGMAVYVSSGTFTMLSGKICGNTNISQGGAMKIDLAGTFNMWGGEISGNSAGSGGGIYSNSNTTINIHYGTISGNSAQSGGGGIFAGGTLNMYDGTISGNSAQGSGGGVYADGIFNMYGGTISGNSVFGEEAIADNDSGQYNGGGVYLNGTLNMYDGTISGNSARRSGGGVHILRDSIFNMSGGIITGNRAQCASVEKDGGGGVHVGGTFNLSGASQIKGNYINGTFNPTTKVYEADETSEPNNCYLPQFKLLTIGDGDETAEDSDEFNGKIGITTKVKPTVSRSVQVTNNWIVGETNMSNSTIWSDENHKVCFDSTNPIVLSAYSITYYNQGASDNIEYDGSAIQDNKYVVGVGLTLQTSVSKTGYTFGGWYTTFNGGTAVTQIAASEYGDKVFYAKWNAKTYSLTLDKNGASVNGGAIATYNSDTLSNFEGVTRADYVLNGYYTSTSGGSMVINADGTLVDSLESYIDASGTWIMDSDITLYAQWRALMLKATYSSIIGGYTITGINQEYYNAEADANGIATLVIPKRWNNSINGEQDVKEIGSNAFYSASSWKIKSNVITIEADLEGPGVGTYAFDRMNYNVMYKGDTAFRYDTSIVYRSKYFIVKSKAMYDSICSVSSSGLARLTYAYEVKFYDHSGSELTSVTKLYGAPFRMQYSDAACWHEDNSVQLPVTTLEGYDFKFWARKTDEGHWNARYGNTLWSTYDSVNYAAYYPMFDTEATYTYILKKDGGIVSTITESNFLTNNYEYSRWDFFNRADAQGIMHTYKIREIIDIEGYDDDGTELRDRDLQEYLTNSWSQYVCGDVTFTMEIEYELDQKYVISNCSFEDGDGPIAGYKLRSCLQGDDYLYESNYRYMCDVMNAIDDMRVAYYYALNDDDEIEYFERYIPCDVYFDDLTTPDDNIYFDYGKYDLSGNFTLQSSSSWCTMHIGRESDIGDANMSDVTISDGVFTLNVVSEDYYVPFLLKNYGKLTILGGTFNSEGYGIVSHNELNIYDGVFDTEYTTVVIDYGYGKVYGGSFVSQGLYEKVEEIRGTVSVVDGATCILYDGTFSTRNDDDIVVFAHSGYAGEGDKYTLEYYTDSTGNKFYLHSDGQLHSEPPTVVIDSTIEIQYDSRFTTSLAIAGGTINGNVVNYMQFTDDVQNMQNTQYYAVEFNGVPYSTHVTETRVMRRCHTLGAKVVFAGRPTINGVVITESMLHYGKALDCHMPTVDRDRYTAPLSGVRPVPSDMPIEVFDGTPIVQGNGGAIAIDFKGEVIVGSTIVVSGTADATKFVLFGEAFANYGLAPVDAISDENNTADSLAILNKAKIIVDQTEIIKTYGETWVLPTASTNFGTVTCDKAVGDMSNVNRYVVTYSVASSNLIIGDSKTVIVTIIKQKVTKPAEDTSIVIADGTSKTYAIAADDRYSVSGNVKSDFGIYTVTVALKDIANYEWADGTTANLSYVFVIRQPQLQDKADDTEAEESIIVTTENGFAPDMTIVITVVEEKDTTNADVTDAEEVVAVYDVKLLVGGIETQPDDTITLKILIPAECKGKTFRILRIHGDEITRMNYTIDGDYIVITTDRLSEFIFVVDKNSGTDTASLLWLIILLAILLSVEVVVLIMVARRKSKKGNVKTYSFMPILALGTAYALGEEIACIVLGIACALLAVAIAIEQFAKKNKPVAAMQAAAMCDGADDAEVQSYAGVDDVQNEEAVDCVQDEAEIEMQRIEDEKRIEEKRQAAQKEVAKKICDKVSAESVSDVISDSVANALIEKRTTKFVGKRVKAIVNLDNIADSFRKNGIVNLEGLQNKGLVGKKVNYVKVLARGTLEKQLTIEANEFSIDAAKMVLLTGGKVIKLSDK